MSYFIENTEIQNIINENEYILNCKSNDKKDISSLTYLINDMNLSQSDSIKFGNAIEKLLNDIIMKYNTFNLQNIKKKNEKNKKETDHLYIDNVNKVIYYAEIKCNLNLDTEKYKSTINKCLNIKDELQEFYHEYKIQMCLVGARYYKTEIITKNIIKKFKVIQDNLFGINEYLQLYNIDKQFIDEEDYIMFLKYIAKQMFNNS
jgi:hypothetical protein